MPQTREELVDGPGARGEQPDGDPVGCFDFGDIGEPLKLVPIELRVRFQTEFPDRLLGQRCETGAVYLYDKAARSPFVGADSGDSHR